MSLVFSAICPHPPIIIPTIGGTDDLKKVSKTIGAFKSLNQKLKDSEAQTVIIVSPHSSLSAQEFTISISPEFFGDFSLFGDKSDQFYFKNDINLATEIIKICKDKGIALKTVEEEFLDHGSLVPLYYLSQKNKFNLIVIGYSFLSLKEQFNFGKALQEVINQASFEKGALIKKKIDHKIAFIASGDLSHRLTQNAPAGYSPKGKVFDETIIDDLKNNPERIININPELSEQAGECGLRSIAILLGVINGLNLKPEILSYENPFGVGYLTAYFK